MEGQTVSHYRILEKLGGGGMGVVYKALDTKLKRTVALKFLPPELTRDDEARKRFVQEAQAASALDHPNICTVYDIDSTPEGQLFIAMAFYDGETLKKRIERGPLSIEEALDVAMQVAQGLTKAHGAGIIHRDIKPANLIVTKDGFVKIVDFGIAKLMGVTGPTQTGTTLGTVAYMSPEQINGEAADKQTDLWSLGAVVYEMLTGQIPFRGEHQLVLMNAIVNEPPKALRSLRPEIPTEVERLVTRALEKKREARYESAGDLLKDVTECHTTLTRPVSVESMSPWQVLMTPKVAIAALVVVALVGGAAFWGWERGADARWAREEAIPEIMRLVEEDQYVAAFELAEEAERHIPTDLVLASLWPQISVTGSIVTTPTGADVYAREYSSQAEWEYLGQSPLADIRLPRGTFRWRIEKDGYDGRILAQPSGTSRGLLQTSVNRPLVLQEKDSTPPRMVFVPGGARSVPISGFDLNDRVALAPFFIDQYEVTNREFKEFVDSGGYEREEYWAGLEFIEEGRPLSWNKAMAEFRDSTARPGPATWELGDYPEGQEDYPVTGVSWYEAAAYANFKGKSLPTVFHWARAMGGFPLATPLSNFAQQGPAPVGTYQGMGWAGTSDMAGNVREWCWNESGDHRWILGGAWSDPEYMFSLPYDLPPFDRSAINGFRLMQSPEVIPDEALMASVEMLTRDHRGTEPVSDDVFQAFKGQFSYTRSELNASVESIDESAEDWIRERVSFDTAYGNERMSAYLFLPKNAEPPYQTVVHFPGLAAFQRQASSEDLQPRFGDFIVRSGRALVWPIYKGSFERWDRYQLLPDEDFRLAFRDRIVEWWQDMSRALDFLETREDFDQAAVAYFGLSYGASVALPVLALEERFRVGILWSGGFSYRTYPPIGDAANYVPRVTIPILMLNGSYDYLFPAQTSQRPLFDLLGTPQEQKRYVTYDAGHGIWTQKRGQVIKESLDWLDKYLGPVN